MGIASHGKVLVITACLLPVLLIAMPVVSILAFCLTPVIVAGCMLAVVLQSNRSFHWWCGTARGTALLVLAVVLHALSCIVAKYKLRAWARSIMARVLGLSPPDFRVKTMNVDIPLGDGHVTRATVYYPHIPTWDKDALPVVLMRTPYKREGLAGRAMVYAERGYVVVAQDTRFESSGDFFPCEDEGADGGATLDWIAEQEWGQGPIGMVGVSYLGLTSWAAASGRRPQLKALVPCFASTRLYPVVYPGGILAFELMLKWSYIVLECAEMSPLKFLLRAFVSESSSYHTAISHVPLKDVDSMVLGKPVKFVQDGLTHTKPTTEFWKELSKLSSLKDVPPVHIIGGWFDFFCQEQLKDYAAAKAAGQSVRLTIGPWSHWDVTGFSGTCFRESLEWFDIHLKQKIYPARPPVNIFVIKSGWKCLESWPPTTTKSRVLFLTTRGGLASAFHNEDKEGCVRYTYDPARPTPYLGGPSFQFRNCGEKDQRELEKRDDVLTFTTPPMSTSLEVMGAVDAELYVHSSCAHTDFLARMCHVDREGTSTNVCEGMVRLEPSSCPPVLGGRMKVTVPMGCTAVLFSPGESLRLHVCSGAHPRLVRNLGAGEPLATATEMRVQEQAVFMGPLCPSLLRLPVVRA